MLSNLNRQLIVCFLSGFIGLSMYAQTDTIPLVTELSVTKNDTVFKSNFLYVNKKKSLETKYFKTASEWNRHEQTEWTFQNDAYANIYFRKWVNDRWMQTYQINFDRVGDVMQAEIHFVFEDGSPSYKSKKTYKYMANNLLDYTLDYIWSNSLWQFDKKTSYHYNANNQADTITFTQYRNNKIVSVSRLVNDFQGNIASAVTFQQREDTVWKNESRTEYYYGTTSNKPNYEVKKNWDTINHVWRNNQNITYTYRPDGNLAKEFYQTWNSQFWSNDLSYTYEYDAGGKLTGKTTNLPIYKDFRPQSQVSYSDFKYDKPTLIEATYDFWGVIAGDSINIFLPYQFNDEQAVAFGSKINMSYLPVDNTGITTVFGNSSREMINIYPNPSKDIFYFDASRYNIQSWLVTDITGKIVLNNSHPGNSGVIDLGSNKSGVYLLMAKTKNKILTQKLIKL